MKKGSCLCGTIQFEVETFIPHTTNCFCGMCRKFHGAAYATFGVVPLSGFRLLAGESQVKHYRAENGSVRSFCSECGSSLFYQCKESGNTIDVALGAMDDEPEVRPVANIYTAHKASWVEMLPRLPTYANGHGLS